MGVYFCMHAMPERRDLLREEGFGSLGSGPSRVDNRALYP